MAADAFEGLCGVSVAGGVPCRFEMGHGGDHSWGKRAPHHRVPWPTPKGCICQPLRADDGSIVEYVFDPECFVHAVREEPLVTEAKKKLLES